MTKLIHWFDIPATDIERAGAFYSTILGLELTHIEAPPDFVMKWFPTGDDTNGYVAFFLDTEGNRVGLQSMH